MCGGGISRVHSIYRQDHEPAASFHLYAPLSSQQCPKKEGKGRNNTSDLSLYAHPFHGEENYFSQKVLNSLSLKSLWPEQGHIQVSDFSTSNISRQETKEKGVRNPLQ